MNRPLLPRWLSGRAVEPDRQGAYGGLFAARETDAGAPEWPSPHDFDDGNGRLEESIPHRDRAGETWWTPRYWRGRRKPWWAARLFAAVLLAFFLLVGWLAVTAPLSKSLEPVVPPEITLLAADGTPIARKGAVMGEPVDVDTLPDHAVEAFLAIEDRRFYGHWGVDPRGLGRALWANVSGGRVQGGSTITQQLAKFTFLTPERSLTRKGREMLIAFWLEAWLTKDEILARYLSNAYFGDNVYGLRAASLHYFYRRPENLTTAQAAMLAGLVQAPSALRPTKHYERAERRMRLVVAAMVEAGYLTQGEADGLRSPALDVRLRSDVPTGTYFADWALPAVRRATEGGYASQTVTTTLDARLQTIARRLVEGARLNGAEAALVAMRRNGEVIAMVGGRDYAKSPFNRATQARRQPGSTFKTFVYLAALENGWRPGDAIENTEIMRGSYRPRNAGGRYSPTITLEDGFARSSNVAAVRLLGRVGDEAVIDLARALGISSKLAPGDPSLALGTSSVTLLELTAAYAGIAGNAFPVRPTPFTVREANWWERLWNRPDTVSARSHADIEAMLRRAVNAGTGRAAMLPGPNFGKTGTTQDNRDALFVGYAGDLVVGVWIGNDDNSPLGEISGGTMPARIWRDFMRAAQRVPAARPAPPRPGASVRPLDDPEATVPPGGAVRIDGEGVSITTDVDGVPVGVRMDGDGVRVESEAIEQARREAERARDEVRRQAEELRRDLEREEAERRREPGEQR